MIYINSLTLSGRVSSKTELSSFQTKDGNDVSKFEFTLMFKNNNVDHEIQVLVYGINANKASERILYNDLVCITGQLRFNIKNSTHEVLCKNIFFNNKDEKIEL